MSKRRGKQHLKKNAPSLRRERQEGEAHRRAFKGAISRDKRDEQKKEPVVNFYEAALTVEQDTEGILTTPASPVEEITPEVIDVCSRLVWVTKHDPNCLGIAAPQVGVQQRIFTVKDTDGFVSVWINPVVERKDGSLSAQEYEGCFSLPDQRVSVARATAVVVRGLAPDGSSQERTFAGKAARVVQHEMDHLDGVLISAHGPLEPVHGDVIDSGETLDVESAEELAEELRARLAQA